MTQALNWFRRRVSPPDIPVPSPPQNPAAEPSLHPNILDATGCVVMVVDISTGNVVSTNRPTEIVTGFQPSELLDRPLWDTIMVSEDRPAMEAAYDASVRAGVPLSYESIVATKSGEQRRVVWSGEFLLDDLGARTHLVMTGIDVTATQSTGGLFGRLMRAATTTAFVATDLEGRVTLFSSGAEQMLGYAAREILGNAFPLECFETKQLRARAAAMGVSADLRLLTVHNALLDDRRGDREFDLGVHDRRRAEDDERDQSQVQSVGPRAHDWTMVRKDGTQFTVSVSVDQVTDTSGQLVGHLCVGHDVTDQRTTEDLLFATLEMEREAVERLRKLDQTKTEFVATVSHELRTPMTSISGYTELLQDGAAGDLTPSQQEFVEAIGRNCDRLTALANDLLTLSSLESGTFRHDQEDVDLCAVISVAHAALQPVLDGKRLEVTFAMPPKPVVVRGDALSLERLVLNLMTNAVKFTEDGGWVRCQLRVVGDKARLEVSDNGIGIPEEEQKELFTRFFRSSNALERAIQGSGLGLTIVESIAHSHDGDISIVSAPMRGTTFTVNLPLKQEPDELERRRRSRL
jgi:hypothetical protein